MEMFSAITSPFDVLTLVHRAATRKMVEDILGSNRLEVFHLAAAALPWGQCSFCPTRGDEPWSEH